MKEGAERQRADGASDADTLITLLGLRSHIFVRSQQIFGATPEFFGATSVPTPSASAPPEATFLRLLSWLYVTYMESGRFGVRFLTDRAEAFGVSGTSALTRHPRDVHALRTYSHHNLNLKRPKDLQTAQRCQDWFTEWCGRSDPESNEDWESCVTALSGEAKAFLSVILETIEAISADESLPELISIWIATGTRILTTEAMDDAISSIAADMGRPELNVARFRERYWGPWSAELRTMAGDFEIQQEFRRLVERELLKDESRPLPITGNDVMAALGLQPGILVGALLRWASASYQDNPCPADELTARVVAHYHERQVTLHA